MPAARSLHHAGLVLALAVSTFAVTGCGGGSSTASTVPADPVVTARTQVFDRINALRASQSLAPLSRWTDGEACAAGQAQTDYVAGTPHSSFPSCGESAQSEAVGWATLDLIATDALQAMWDQGPGDFATHGDYINLSSTTYHKVAIGIYVTPANTVWATLNFAP